MGLFEGRIVRQPLIYPEAHKYIHAIYSGFWTDQEFSFLSDVGQFKTALSDKEREIMTRTLSAIGQVEIAVKTFWAKLGEHFPHPEISDLGYAMSNSEVIHNMAYERLLTVLGLERVFEENLKVPVVRDRVNYLKKHSEKVYKDDQKQYLLSLILFTNFVENCSLFSQFYIIQHFNKTRAILKDTAQQVLYTRNEEDLHRMIGVWLVNTVRKESPHLFDLDLSARVWKETVQALEVENSLIDWLLNGYEEKGLSAPILKAFVKNRMRETLNLMGFDSPELDTTEKSLLKATEWFDISQHGTIVTDFFAQRPVEYNKHYRAFTREDLWRK